MDTKMTGYTHYNVLMVVKAGNTLSKYRRTVCLSTVCIMMDPRGSLFQNILLQGIFTLPSSWRLMQYSLMLMV